MYLRWLPLLLFVFFQSKYQKSTSILGEKYKQALILYESDDPSDFTDSISERLFREILGDPSFSVLDISTQYNVYEKLGSLSRLKSDTKSAIGFYRSALKIDNYDDLRDTMFFRSNLFLGETYYLSSKADSSVFFLEKAEELLAGKASKNEASRIYNSLGVIYYESGNYTQSTNYFQKARSLIIGDQNWDKMDPYFKYAAYSFSNNIASSLSNLNKFDSALTIYKNLISSGIELDRTYSQISGIYLQKNRVDSALNYLEKVGEGFQNNYAFVKLKAVTLHRLGRSKESMDLLDGFIQKSIRFQNRSKDFRMGKIFLIKGDILFDLGKFEEAAQSFQNAMIQIDDLFDNENLNTNPNSYSFDFGSYSLFESLVGKAKSLGALGKSDEKMYQLSLATYQAAFEISYTIGNYFDNDEARIFLGEKALEAFEEGIKILLEIYQIEKKPELLINALSWVEESKSLSLKLALSEKKLKTLTIIPNELIQHERDLLYSISKLQQNILSSDNNENKIEEYQKELLDKRIELSRLNDKFNDFPNYLSRKLKRPEVDIQLLQDSLLLNHQLVVSFFEVKEEILVFILNSSGIDYYSISKNERLIQLIANFKNNISRFELGQRYNKGILGYELFLELFGKNNFINSHESILIVPHGILSGIPFEALENQDGEYLVKNHFFIYQSSLKFLTNNIPKVDQKSVVGFAPFSSGDWEGDEYIFSRLVHSRREIESYSRSKFFGEEATKEKFLEEIVNFKIIHLATHAVAEEIDFNNSFITFYPGSYESRLYAHEIATLDLGDQTSLVILSACETNYGPESSSEGILGLARSFAFAGCPNIITSLWKADDKVTSYLSSRFYYHLESKNNFAESLAWAKRDFLSDPSFSGMHHPFFWSNLILIGELDHSQKTYKNVFIWILIALLFFLLALYRLDFFQKRNLS